MEVQARRANLECGPNPQARLDYVVELEGAVGGASVRVRYVPDREVVSADAFARYLAVVEGLAWETLEAMAAAVLDDVNNEAVPRWVQVTARRDGHAVMQEDRQPQWDNKALLSRLQPF